MDRKGTSVEYENGHRGRNETNKLLSGNSNKRRKMGIGSVVCIVSIIELIEKVLLEGATEVRYVVIGIIALVSLTGIYGAMKWINIKELKEKVEVILKIKNNESSQEQIALKEKRIYKSQKLEKKYMHKERERYLDIVDMHPDLNQEVAKVASETICRDKIGIVLPDGEDTRFSRVVTGKKVRNVSNHKNSAIIQMPTKGRKE